MYRRRGGAPSIGLLFLFMEVARIGVEYIPPGTLLFLAINVIIHLFDPLHLDIHQVCIGAAHVIGYSQFSRLALASVYHLDDMHLYYNMSSLLWKGRILEPQIGTKRFVSLVVVLAVLSNAILTAINYIGAVYFDKHEMMYTCAAGFSAVLFGLKVVLTKLNRHHTTVLMGLIPLSGDAVFWGELLLIQVLIPHASFLGHLSGILAGLLYTNGYLNFLFAIIDSVLPDIQYDNANNYRNVNYNNYNYNSNNTYNAQNDYYQQPRRRVIRNGVVFYE